MIWPVPRQKISGMPMQQRHAAVMQRHVAILPLARFVPLMQRQQNGDRREKAGRDINDRRAETRRAAGLGAVNRHQPDHRL
jgi:hypothetical protein